MRPALLIFGLAVVALTLVGCSTVPTVDNTIDDTVPSDNTTFEQESLQNFDEVDEEYVEIGDLI